MSHNNILLPSLLSADFINLGENIRRVTSAGAAMLHLDIMDGHFVPNISFGSGIVKQIRSNTSLTLDTHLMIENPDIYLEDFKNAGTDILTVHIEACNHAHRTISRIKELNMKVGVSLNPATPIQALQEILPDVDLVLVMSVDPGFGGQKFIESSLKKIAILKNMINEQKLDTIIEVDGGIDATTISAVRDAGANYFVAGNAIFGNGDIGKNFRQLEQLIRSN